MSSLYIADLSREQISTLNSPNSEIQRCAISPDGGFAVGAGKHGALVILDAAGNKPLTLQASGAFVQSLAIIPSIAFGANWRTFQSVP